MCQGKSKYLKEQEWKENCGMKQKQQVGKNRAMSAQT
jgi:hypothetical protein